MNNSFYKPAPGAKRKAPGDKRSPWSFTLGPLRLAVCGLLFHAPLFANDVVPPCWRGQAGTTFQQWTFPTPDEQPAPDFSSNAYGAAQATAAPNWDGGAEGWTFQFPLCGFGCVQSNYWDMGPGGVMTVTIPNAPGSSPTAYRLVWLQVAQFISAVYDNAYAGISIPNAVQVGGQTNTVQIIPGGTGSWVVQQTLWQLPPSSVSQTITLTTGPSGGVIDGIVVDTRYVEPTAISPGGNLNVGMQSECGNFNVLPASTYIWELSNAAGAAGVGFDQLSLTSGNLDVQATGISKSVINLITLNGSTAGPAANFNPDTPSSWPIASASGGILNFDAAKFTLNHATTQFQNDLRGGVFSLTTNIGSLLVQFTPNRAPVANPVSLTRNKGTGIKINIANLISGSTSDPDGDARVLLGVSGASNGSFTNDGTCILYTPFNDNDDTLSYTVGDVRSAYRAGDVRRTATSTINIDVVTEGSQGGIAQVPLLSGGTATINFAGVPGFAYEVQRAEDVNFTVNVTQLRITNAPAGGVFQVLDPGPLPPAAFYRLHLH